MPKVIDQYIEAHNKYVKLYGEKTLVLIQVGGFYETYGTDDMGPDLLAISKLIGAQRSKKGKDKKLSINDPWILGFPIVSLLKFVEILINENYTVIVIDQIDTDKSKCEKKKNGEEREVVNIYSKGTFIENLTSNEGNYIICMYISRDPQKNSQPLLSVGLSAVDVSTGHVYIHEAYSSKYDEYYALDETERFISTLKPKEIIIHYKNNVKDKNEKNDDIKEKILSYLRLDNESCRYCNKPDLKYEKLVVQNEILLKVYPQTKSIISPIEQLNLEKNIYAIISLCTIFDFICDKNKKLLHHLTKPDHFINDTHLVLGNNAIGQLDVITNSNNYNQDTIGYAKNKYKNLFDVVNHTSTALGERFLRNRLLSPIVDIDELNKMYNNIEYIQDNNLFKQVEVLLDGIRDIERLQRKIELNILRPVEVQFLLTSYENIEKLIKIVKKTKLNILLPSKESIENITKFRNHVDNIFNLNELEKYALITNMETQIFKPGKVKEIEKLLNNSGDFGLFMEKLKNSLNEIIIKEVNISTKVKKTSYIDLKKTQSGQFYLKLTDTKAITLRKKILCEKKDRVKIYIDEKEFDVNELKFIETGTGNVKITLVKDCEYCDPKECREKIMKLNKKNYIEELLKIYNFFNEMFQECNEFVSIIDFIKSSAKCAKLNGYTRPTLMNESYGYINAKKLRHPIIERIIDYEYVPHDVELGNNLKGMLLYGVNTSGKSSVMKAIGLIIILAQSGMFVPCDDLILSPYLSLYTRIAGNDNLFKGMSSFSLEMIELNAIFKRAGSKMLVIGDEISKGTEFYSSNGLVASAIVELSKSDTSFIFATHLHELVNLDIIKNLTTVKSFHLSVDFDEKTNKLIFDRSMKEGSGRSDYGITVAQFIIQNKEFIDLAIKIKNQMLEIQNGIVGNGKTSKYNSNVLVNECKLCGAIAKDLYVTNIETHHVNFQKDTEKNGIIKGKKHLKKNDSANLISLCNKCHDYIHNGKVKLDKYVMTSNGKEILFKK